MPDKADSMQDEIVNKVAQSGLITLSPEDFYRPGERLPIDIAPWLYEGIMLREKDFRQALKDHQWDVYAGKFVYIYCSTDAIIPQWAYMLLASYLSAAEKVVYGNREMLESVLMEEAIDARDFSEYKDQRVIIKGCSHLPIPPHAYSSLVLALQKHVKSIMYGEACSTVPVFKLK